MSEKPEAAIRARIEELMKAGVSADLATLDQIYHEDLHILSLDGAGGLMELTKPACLAMLQEVFAGENPEDHMWAKFHSISVTGERAHVLISRRIPIGGPKMMIDLSIDLLFEDGRWQVIREVNFARPEAEAA